MFLIHSKEHATPYPEQCFETIAILPDYIEIWREGSLRIFEFFLFDSHLPLPHTWLVTTGSGACCKTSEAFPLGSVFPQPVNQHCFPTINMCKFIETLSVIPKDTQVKKTRENKRHIWKTVNKS